MSPPVNRAGGESRGDELLGGAENVAKAGAWGLIQARSHYTGPGPDHMGL